MTPVYGDYTEVGKNKKKEIEEYFIKPEFETKTTNDGMISIPMYKIVLDNGENFESPDLANGGYIRIQGACPPKYTTSLGVFTLATAKSAKTTKSAKNTRSAMRPTFAKHPDPIEIPDLLSLQTESFDWLVGNPAWRELAGKDAKTGLDEVFEEISPIEDSANAAQDAKITVVEHRLSENP